jgi:thioredoxin-dependent peroxiredoxin
MSAELHCDRLTDVPIALAGGGMINLAHFCGQKLIVFFCPIDDSAAAAREISAYEATAADFEHAGAWIVGIAGPQAQARVEDKQSIIHLGSDADGSAFRALASFVPENSEIGAEQGTTFLIDRDGGIRAAWPGCGHAARALEIARERP